MSTVKKLIEELQKFPPDAIAWAYCAETTGITIYDPTDVGSSSIGFIPVFGAPDSGEAEDYRLDPDYDPEAAKRDKAEQDALFKKLGLNFET
jgi:hypothetical protein